MANQPPARPWFRLASLRGAPVPAPAPAPAPTTEPRPLQALHTFRTSSAPSSPQPTQPSETTPPAAAAPVPTTEPRPLQALPTLRTSSAQSSPQPSEPPAAVPPAPAPSRAPALIPTLAPAPTATRPQPAPAVVTAAQLLGAAERASGATSSVPTSPVQKLTTSSVPSAPSPKPAQPPSNSSPAKAATTTAARVASPTQSPKTIKPTVQTPIQSPKPRPTAPLPSPLNLPPSQLKTSNETEPKILEEAERKTVLVQKTVEKPKQWLNGNGESQRELKPKELEAKLKGIHRKHSDSEDSGMRVITIAGENRGAYMEVIPSPKKDKPNYLHQKGNSKTKNSGGESESYSSEDGNVHKKDKSHKGRTASSFPMTAFMNSNVQCVNNSILYHASCTHHDPGVRLSLSKKPYGEGFHLKEHANGQYN